MSREQSSSTFEYDVAISFASQQKSMAEQLFRLLDQKSINVFLDEYTGSETWGVDGLDHLVNLYARKARYCVLLISKEFPLRQWTEAERTAVQQRALRDANEYILPVRLDETHIPGLDEASGYQDIRELSLESVVDFIEKKLEESVVRANPPTKSHDLRSGNVPSQNESDS